MLHILHTNTCFISICVLCLLCVLLRGECLFNFVETESKMYFLECVHAIVQGGAKQTNCNKEFTFGTLYVLLNTTQTTKIYL